MIGTLLGGLTAARAMRDYTQNIDSEIRQAARRRDRLLAEDPTQRADARHLLTQLDSTLRQRIRRTEAREAITGGTSDTSASERRNATESMASAASAITADARTRADNADRDYQQLQSRLRNQRRTLLTSQASDATKAGAQLDSALIGGMIWL